MLGSVGGQLLSQYYVLLLHYIYCMHTYVNLKKKYNSGKLLNSCFVVCFNLKFGVDVLFSVHLDKEC